MIQTKELKKDAVEVRYSRYETAINQHSQLKHELFNLWNDIVKKIVITISTTSIMGFYSWIWLYLASLFFSQ